MNENKYPIKRFYRFGSTMVKLSPIVLNWQFVKKVKNSRQKTFKFKLSAKLINDLLEIGQFQIEPIYINSFRHNFYI